MQHRKQNAGFSLILAIFVLVVLALAVTYVVSLASLTESSAIYGLNRERAYYAAYSGAEWGLYQALNNSSCAAATTFSMPNGSAIQGFSVTVQCSSTSYTQGSGTYSVYSITSLASKGSFGNSDYVASTVTASASNIY